LVKLSGTQAEVVRRMRSGWQLRYNLAAPRAWLQKEDWTETVSRATVTALLRRGVVIEAAREWPVVKYKLVEG
jgi:hypothetical protein